MRKINVVTLLFGVMMLSSSAIAGQWHYNTSIDKMSGKQRQMALIQSEDSLSLGFPYSGRNYGHLVVRKHPQYGLDVIVSVEQGQMLCGVGQCKLRIRFDDASAKTFTMVPSGDQSSNTLFARYPEWAINKLKNANRIFVQVPMYREGNQLLEFQTDKVLVWPPADSSDISQATSSNHLSKADLAWHAQNITAGTAMKSFHVKK